MTIVAGYCKLCRTQEFKRHGKLVRGIWHKHACRVAGCKHPPEYSTEELVRGTPIGEELRIQAERFREFCRKKKNSLEKVLDERIILKRSLIPGWSSGSSLGS